MTLLYQRPFRAHDEHRPIGSDMPGAEYQPTPRLTDHARQRCEEMDIRTRRVKRVVRSPDLRYCSYDGRTVVCRFDEPTFRVVVNMDTEVPTVVTVVWWSSEQYERPA